MVTPDNGKDFSLKDFAKDDNHIASVSAECCSVTTKTNTENVAKLTILSLLIYAIGVVKQSDQAVYLLDRNSCDRQKHVHNIL